MYCQAVGASAMQQLIARGIHPLKVEQGASISEIVSQLRQELREEPRGWLAKAILRIQQPRDDKRFDVMADEGWQE